MGLDCRRIFLATVFFLTAVWVFACEDTPEECFSNADCPSGHRCEATYYLDGTRSGGYCEVLVDAGTDAAADAGGDPDTPADAGSAPPPDDEDAGDDQGA